MEITPLEDDLMEWTLALVKRVPLFSGLTKVQSHILMKAAQLVRLESGETLVKQGLPADSFFLILEGTVSVYSERDSESVRLGTLQAPTSVGEIGLLLDKNRTATVIADTQLQALRFMQPGFIGLFNEVEGFGLAITRAISHRLEDLSARVANVNQQAEGKTEAPTHDDTVQFVDIGLFENE